MKRRFSALLIGAMPVSMLPSSTADVDNNGRVDSTDARLILQYAVKKIAAFPQSE